MGETIDFLEFYSREALRWQVQPHQFNTPAIIMNYFTFLWGSGR